MEKKYCERYAKLLVNYCCELKPMQRVLIRSSYLAEPLVLACQKEALKLGALCEIDISLPGFARQLYDYSSLDQLNQPEIFYETAVKKFDAIISIAAPYDCFELKGVSETKISQKQTALKPIKTHLMKRGSKGNLKWVICNYPTKSLAKTDDESNSGKQHQSTDPVFDINAALLQFPTIP